MFQHRFLLISCILFCLIPLHVFPTETAENFIQNVHIDSNEKSDQIQLTFSQNYRETVSQHFDDGLVKITLPNTDYKKDSKLNLVNDRFIRMIRLYKEGKSTILEIQFADLDFQPIGKVSSKAAKNTLTISINKSTLADSLNDQAATVYSSLSDRKEAKPLSVLGTLQNDSSITVNIIKMLIAVTAILIFFYGILWFYNKFFVSRFSFKKGDHTIKLITSYHLSPKQRIVILKVDKSTFACGVTPTNISLISEVTDSSFYSYLDKIKNSNGGNINFTQIRSQYLAQKVAQTEDDTDKPRPPFASELLNRVKKLKPID